MKKLRLVLLLVLALIQALVTAGCSGNQGIREDKAMNTNETYYPGKVWRTSTPEAQGIDSEQLLKMFQTIQESKAPIHSVLIIRNGFLVCEAYFQPFNQSIPHDQFSATKSFMSTLIGIAIDEGKIKSIDQKVTEFFPDVTVPVNDLGIQDLTLKDVLTMSAGHQSDSVDAVFNSSNWAQDFFNLPFSTKPGERFLYDSGASHLLSAILQKATGKSADNYARQHLFNPLEIKDYTWEKSSEGIYTGGWGIRMRPVDMAKFGYLILNKGVWNGKQLVSSGWIEEATKKHIDSAWGDTPGDAYGYQWWMNAYGGFRADGFAGQNIFIMPDKNLIAVITAGSNYSEQYQPVKIMGDLIVPSLISDTPLPANEKANNELNACIKELEAPTPVLPAALPETATKISGKTYQTDSLISQFSLDFRQEDICMINMTQSGKAYKFPVGLDGVYRVSDASRVGTLVYYPPYKSIALKGRWEGSNTFIMDWQYVGEPYKQEYKFTFEGDNVTLEITEYVVGGAGPQTPYAKYAGSLVN